MKQLLILLLIVACQSNAFALKPTKKFKHLQKSYLKHYFPSQPKPDGFWHDTPADEECIKSKDPTVDETLNCAKRARVKL